MKISIIVPTFNEEKSIPALAESIEKIEVENFDCEIILADGSSEDCTIGLVTDLGWQIVHVRSRPWNPDESGSASLDGAGAALPARGHAPATGRHWPDRERAGGFSGHWGNFSLLFSGSSRERDG
jgi:cellulose synthase/poly-beta-1,6-N-acetylglucosamine synthase-like glycosyltransferase